MSFAFNFDGPTAAATTTVAASKPREEFTGRVGWIELSEVGKEPAADAVFSKLELANDISLFVRNGHATSKTHSVAKNREVLPLVYEGGFKIWECSYDLIASLAASTCKEEKELRILDLGCGAGLVGMWCLARFPNSTVVFHDLNDSVLLQVTMPNVLRNAAETTRTWADWRERARFCCGPWHLESNLGEFDLVLSGDTMYNVEALPDLANILLSTVGRGGRGLLAAKRYYFGVGGGSSSFCALLREPQYRARCQAEIISSITDGSSNIRDVVEFKVLLQ